MRKSLCLLGMALKIFLWCFSLNAAAIWNVPPENRFFTGRDETLQEIESKFNKKGESFVTLVGISGVGKTQIAKKYVHLHLREYDIVWWFDASKDLEAQFLQLANQWQNSFPESFPSGPLSSEDLIAFIKNILNTTDKNWLLIFDNATSYEDFERYLPSVQLGYKKIIVTSCNSNAWPNKILLSELSQKDAFHLLKKLGEVRPEREKDLEKILKISEKYPLSLIRIADFIRQHKSSFQDYVCLQKKEHLSHWLKKKAYLKVGEFSDGYKEKTLESLDGPLERLRNIYPRAHYFLSLLCFLNSKEISFETLEKVSDLLEPLKGEMEDILSALKASSFIEDQDEDHPYLSVPAIIQSFIKTHLKEDDKIKFLKMLIGLFKKELLQNWDEIIKIFHTNRELLNHLKALERNIKELKDPLPEELILKVAFLENDIYRACRENDAGFLFEEVQKLLDVFKSATLSELTVARFKIDKVYDYSIYNREEKIKELEEDIEKAIMYFQKTENKEELMRAYTHKAQYFLVQGKFEMALEILNKAEFLYQDIQSNASKILFLYAKSCILSEFIDFHESEKLLHRLLPILEKETNTLLKLYALIIKAKVLTEIGKDEEGFKEANYAYETSLKYFPSCKNIICGKALEIIAQFHKRQGNLEKAKKFIEKSLLIYEDVFRGKQRHPTQGAAYAFYGEILETLGEKIEALDAYQTSEKIYIHFLQERISASKALGDILKKIAILGVNLQDSNISRHYLNLIIKYFGSGSRYAREILKYLDEKDLCLP